MDKDKLKESLSPKDKFFFDDIIMAREMCDENFISSNEEAYDTDFDALYGVLE